VQDYRKCALWIDFSFTTHVGVACVPNFYFWGRAHLAWLDRNQLGLFSFYQTIRKLILKYFCGRFLGCLHLGFFCALARCGRVAKNVFCLSIAAL
jgi:hypothetical protein